MLLTQCIGIAKRAVPGAAGELTMFTSAPGEFKGELTAGNIEERKERTEMNRRIILSVSGVTAGLLTATFVPTGVALADNGAGTVGDVGSTALASGLASNPGATALLGSTGALGPDVNAPSPTLLGDTGAITPSTGATPEASTTGSSPLGDTGGITPTVGTPDTTPGDTTPTGSEGFTIGQDTFTPVQADGSEGFTPLTPLFSAPPLFQVGEGEQSFDVSSGTGSGATDLGNVTASENVTNLFGGFHNTEFTITDVDPASGATAADLPAVGTVYDVANFGNGFENIYTDIPGTDGAANTITDTLVTPFGDFNIPTDFDAAALLDPGDAFSGLSALGADAAGGAADAAGGAAGAAGGAADAAAGTAADAAGGAADAAGGAGDSAADLAGSIDPFSFLGF